MSNKNNHPSNLPETPKILASMKSTQQILGRGYGWFNNLPFMGKSIMSILLVAAITATLATGYVTLAPYLGNGSATALQSTQDSSEDGVKNATTSVSVKTATKLTLEQRVTSVESHLYILEATTSQLEKQVATNTADIAEIQGELKRLDKEYSGLISKMEKDPAIHVKVAELEDKIPEYYLKARFGTDFDDPIFRDVGPFITGEAGETKLIAEQISVLKLFLLKNNFKVSVIVGAYDSEKMVKTLHIWGSNQNLARARATFIRDKLGINPEEVEVVVLNDPDIFKTRAEHRSVYVGISGKSTRQEIASVK